MSTSIPASTLEKFTTFGDLLRYLRRVSGLTQLELSVQVGYSHAQISRLEQNLRLPDIPTIEARFVPALDLQDEPKAVARLLDLAANVRREDAPGLGLCPYKGLNYFDEADADLFVGREALTARLTERVLSLTSSESPHETRFLTVVGASGSGKSSLVRAGLVAALRWNKKSADWHIHVLTPTAQPLENLASSLTGESDSVIVTSTLMDDLARDSRSLQIFAKRKLGSNNGSHLLLVIDQFEELFALCHSEEERASFIGNLLTAASEGDGPVMVVITLRADFYTHCANYIQLREALARNQEYIGSMSDDELCRAIEEPARRGRWELEPGLVDLLLHDVGHEPGALPLLSHALFETWQRRRGRVMTLGGYASSGGVRGAIAETAESVLTDQLTNDQRSIARRIFLRLTELSDDAATADTRRRATFGELILRPEDASTTHTVLKALADARLITTGEDSAEVAHEALIREWPTLQGWLEENRDGLRLHRQLTEAAQEWLAMDRTTDVFYRGARLAQTREWVSTHEGDMNALEREFLAASIDASEREVAEREAQHQRELEAAQKLAEAEKHRAEMERQRAEEQVHTSAQLRKRSLYLAGAFVIALVMALTALFFGAQARQAATTAQTQQRIATSRELAAASISNLEVDPEQSILLALEALKMSYTIEAEDALHRAVQSSRIRFVIPAHEPGAQMMLALGPNGKQFITGAADGWVKTWDATTGQQLLKVEGFYAAYSPDEKRLAVLTSDNTIKMIDATTGKEIHFPHKIDANLSVVFSPDGSRLATADLNSAVTWNAKTGEKLAEYSGHMDYVGYTTFSPNGMRLLTASDDGTARVWDTATGQQLLVLSNHPRRVWTARYSPDGRYIATVSGNEAYIWDANSGQRLMTLTGHKNDIYAVDFSPDGSRIATGSTDRRIKVWDTVTGKELLMLAGHTGSVYDLAFRSDGTRLLSSSDDGTVRIWDTTPARELLTLSGNEASGSIAFIMQGSRLATGSATGDVRVWDASSGHELQPFLRHHDPFNAIAFSSDGTRFATANVDSTVQVLDTGTGKELFSLNSHNRQVYDVTFSPDGSHLATAGEDWQAKLWDAHSGQLLFTLQNLAEVNAVTFSPDGTTLVTGVSNGTAKVWDVATGRELLTFYGHNDSILDVAFSPDGKLIVSASHDGTAKIWNAVTGEDLLTLHGHTNMVTAGAFSPDGKRVATVSRDGMTKLWNAATGEELLTLFGSGSGLNNVAFDPEGKRLATSGDDGTRVYLLQIEDLIALARTRVTRLLTSEECQKYLHLDRSTCSPVDSNPTITPLPPAAHGRICLVADPGGLSSPNNKMIYDGVEGAAQKFSWESAIRITSSYADIESEIHRFIRSDCDLIVTVFFDTVDAVRTTSESKPNQKFLLLDFAPDPPIDNAWGQLYATDQAAFLAGYVAASVTKTGKVATFGGMDYQAVLDFMDGFARGVAYYNEKNGTNVEVLGWDIEKREGLFTGSFTDQAAGQSMTQQLIDEGADVILPVAGAWMGLGVLETVEKYGNAYVIGVDMDWATTSPEFAHITLTSIEKRFNVTVVQAVQSIMNDSFTGGIHNGTLETGEVGLAPFHELDSLISAQVKADLEQIEKDIIAGKIKTRP